MQMSAAFLAASVQPCSHLCSHSCKTAALLKPQFAASLQLPSSQVKGMAAEAADSLQVQPNQGSIYSYKSHDLKLERTLKETMKLFGCNEAVKLAAIQQKSGAAPPQRPGSPEKEVQRKLPGDCQVFVEPERQDKEATRQPHSSF